MSVHVYAEMDTPCPNVHPYASMHMLIRMSSHVSADMAVHVPAHMAAHASPHMSAHMAAHKSAQTPSSRRGTLRLNPSNTLLKHDTHARTHARTIIWFATFTGSWDSWVLTCQVTTYYFQPSSSNILVVTQHCHISFYPVREGRAPVFRALIPTPAPLVSKT